VRRIVFHEITEGAIKEAMANPRDIDLHLVDAQQARRILDRLVGYELSPFLWRKVRYGLSAGRVQSVAVRLIVEREREIGKFNKEEYWSIEAAFAKNDAALLRHPETRRSKELFPARLYSKNGKTVGKMEITTEVEAKTIVTALAERAFVVSDITVKDVTRNPAAPFTTSTLQQEASRKLGFSAKQTMVIAQKLYEHGHITYMRTDSLNLAASAMIQAKATIIAQFGKEYALDSPRHYTNKSKGAQEAHEAIRPTNLAKNPEDLGLKDRGEGRLYDLIWKRTLASQMQSALFEATAVDIADDKNEYVFRATGQTVKFDGFIRAYTEGRDEDLEEEVADILPALEKGEALKLDEVRPLQHFTEPPARYTDATLIKTLEAAGVGRPSTYAPTLSTIQEREYVEKVDKRYHPTEVGMIVNDILVEHFPEIVDLNFTSHIEEEFDQIAEGAIAWPEVIREFYEPFKKHLDQKEKEVEKQVEISTTPCPHCGQPMLIKFGRMGKFLACPQEGSKVTLPMPEEAAKIKELTEKTQGELCPICGKPMEVKRGRFGYFLGCVDYPKCKGISKIWNKTGFKCPHCLSTPERRDRPGDIVEKKGRGRGKPFYACTRWPDCTFITNKKPESEEELLAAYEYWKVNPPKAKGEKGTTKRAGKRSAK
jgi:DNA topoisomerase-1